MSIKEESEKERLSKRSESELVVWREQVCVCVCVCICVCVRVSVPVWEREEEGIQWRKDMKKRRDTYSAHFNGHTNKMRDWRERYADKETDTEMLKQAEVKSQIQGKGQILKYIFTVTSTGINHQSIEEGYIR